VAEVGVASRSVIYAVALALAELVAVRASAQTAAASSPTPQPSAASSSAERAGYATLIEQALGEYDSHNFAEARALLTQAHALYPNARTLPQRRKPHVPR
jgi:hypothetical protein